MIYDFFFLFLFSRMTPQEFDRTTIQALPRGRPLARHQPRPQILQDYRHDNSFFTLTNKGATAQFTIAPDWVSERLKPRRRPKKPSHEQLRYGSQWGTVSLTNPPAPRPTMWLGYRVWYICCKEYGGIVSMPKWVEDRRLTIIVCRSKWFNCSKKEMFYPTLRVFTNFCAISNVSKVLIHNFTWTAKILKHRWTIISENSVILFLWL